LDTSIWWNQTHEKIRLSPEPEIYLAAKAPPCLSGIFFDRSGHVKTVVLLTRKSTASYNKEINININNELV